MAMADGGAGADPVIVWPLLAGSVIFLIVGLLAYSGRWASWAVGLASGYTILGLAWLGTAGVMIFLALPLADADGPATRVAAGALGAVGLVCFAVAALSPFWMWHRLKPAWLRDWLASGRPVTRRPSRPGRG